MADQSVANSEWTGSDGARYKRTANGQLRKLVLNNRTKKMWWLAVKDPNYVAKPASTRRHRNKQKAAAGIPRDGVPHRYKAKAGIPLAPEDRVRLKLRETQRKMSKDGEAPTALPAWPGAGSLSIATRYIPGGRATFVEGVQAAMLERQPHAEKWWAVFADLLPSERADVSFDDVCLAAGVRPSKLMAEVISVIMELGRDAAGMVAAMMHAKVLGKMAESAERIDGVHAEIALKDRHAFLQGMGTLPLPRGTTINVNASANAKAAAGAAQEASVPSFVATLGEASAARRALPAANETLSFLVPDTSPAGEAVEAELIRPNDSDD